VRQFGHLPRNI